MDRRSLATLAVVLLTLGDAGAALADSGRERLDSFLDGMRTLNGVFEQSVFDENLRRLEQSRGTLALQRPNRFRFEYVEPFEQLIVADGESVWLYDRELEQVTVRPIRDTIGSTPALLLSSERPLEDDFEIREIGPHAELLWVGLRPLSTDATFRDIRLGFADDGLRMMEMADNFGQVTQLKFLELERNPKLEAGLFEFTPPAGVDVLRDAPAAGKTKPAGS